MVSEEKYYDITFRLLDKVKAPIKGLTYQIVNKTDGKVIKRGITPPSGEVTIKYVGGNVLEFYVKRLETGELKKISTIVTPNKHVKISLVSPKILVPVKLEPHDGDAGTYWKGTYKVKKGDSLSKIAKHYSVSVATLMALNPKLIDPDHIATGIEVNIPEGTTLRVPPQNSHAHRKNPVQTTHPTSTNSPVNQPAPTSQSHPTTQPSTSTNNSTPTNPTTTTTFANQSNQTINQTTTSATQPSQPATPLPQVTNTNNQSGAPVATQLNNNCPRCGVLTLEELKQLFDHDAETVNRLTTVVAAFNEANTKFAMTSCLNKAHFFAQVMQEVGPRFNISNGESLNYSSENLYRVQNDPVTGAKKGPFLNFRGHLDLCNQYGRTATHPANQEMIANIAYANHEGNGPPASGDGWRYRGKGIIQITFKNKYVRINNTISALYPSFGIVIDANNINHLREGTVASMAYWNAYGIATLANTGNSSQIVDAVINIINSRTDSRTERHQHFTLTSTAFRLISCPNSQINSTQPASNSVLEEMKNLVDQHIPYSQQGVRNALTPEGLAALDCSETVAVYLTKLGVMPHMTALSTGGMCTQATFRNSIGSTNIDFVEGSLATDFIPQRGDIFVWRKPNTTDGHTGIVYKYDAQRDEVTILEAIGHLGAVTESEHYSANHGGYPHKNMSRTAVYKRSSGALNLHAGWKGYFRPKNYTRTL